MLADAILVLIGEIPAGYYEAQDKWGAIIAYFIVRDDLFMPWILGAIPIVWLVIRKRRKKHISRFMIIMAAAAVILLFALGFVLLDFLSELAFGLSYQRMYGDLF